MAKLKSARDRIRTDIRLIAGRTVWITRFPCLLIPASGFEPGAAIGSASTSARDHRILRFRRASSFSATRAYFICFPNCCGRVAAFEFRQVIYGLHDATNYLFRRIATVESIMTMVSTVATRRENYLPSHAGHK